MLIKAFNNRKIQSFSILLLALVFQVCVYINAYAVPMQSLSSLTDIPTATDHNETNSPRDQAIGNTAFALGAQRGYRYEMNKLKSAIGRRASFLDRIFNFQSLINILNPNKAAEFMVPPVMQRAKDHVNVGENGQYLKVDSVTYRIISPAHLSTVKPNWRQYLLITPDIQVQPVDKSLLPKNDDETQLWKSYIRKGVSAGIKQANSEMNTRITHLQVEYRGMVLYDHLLLEHKVSRPYIAVSEQNVNGSTNLMNVDEKTYRITVPAKLNKDTRKWTAIGLVGHSDE